MITRTLTVAAIIAVLFFGIGAPSKLFAWDLNFDFTSKFEVNKPKPSHFLVLLDISSTSPLTQDETLSIRSSNFVYEQIKDLKIGSTVDIGYIGSNLGALHRRYQFKIDADNPKETVSEEVKDIIASTYYELTDPNGQLKSENTSHIIEELYYHSQNMTHPITDTIIVSDGLQFSQGSNFYHVAVSDKVEYFLPNNLKILQGSNFTMISLGIGWKNNTTRNIIRLENLWREIATKAGSKNIKLITRNF